MPMLKGQGNPIHFNLVGEFQAKDPRDTPPGYEFGEMWLLSHFRTEVRRRAITSQLEEHVRATAAESAGKSRWQKIIEHANSLADERGMSREEFYSQALIEFIEKIENLRISEELNEAYKNIDQQEDTAFLNHLVSHYDPRLADE